MNNSKAGLLLLELTISILFFTLSCVVIISLFVRSHNTTKEANGIADAIVVAENIAEQYRSGIISYERLSAIEYDKYDVLLEENIDEDMYTLSIHVFDKENYINYCNLEVKKYLPEGGIEQ
ncbi:MAG: hypothetical protein K5662_00900 [Lachnospiraceae bacterium]|nr:hypothetical protein [Lachnospiraceae bacterium]